MKIWTLTLFASGLLLSPHSIAENVPSSVTLQTPHETRIGAEILNRTNGDLANLLKPKSYLDQYFKCYIAAGQSSEETKKRLTRLNDFNAKYGSLIASSAKNFEMPYALSSCIMFKETLFNEDRESSAGARSVAQFTANTYDTLKNNIAWGRDYKKYDDELYEMTKSGIDVLSLKDSPNPLVAYHQFTQKDGPAYEEASDKERIKSANMSRTRMYEGQIASDINEDLDSYLRSAYQALPPDQKRKYFPEIRPGDKPSSWNFTPPEKFDDFVKNPVWVTGLNMYFLKQMMIKTNASVNISQFSGGDLIGFLTVVAGGYNAGHGKLQDVISSGKSVKEWCKDLASNKETREYMQSVRRCLTNGNFYPPANTIPVDECKSLMIVNEKKTNGGELDPNGLDEPNDFTPADPCSEPIIPRPQPRPNKSAPQQGDIAQ